MDVENLKSARKSTGMTQKDVSTALNISPNTYKNYEQGLREPNGDTIVALANLFHVTTDYLLGRPDAKPPDDPVELLAAQYKLGTTEHAIIASYLALPQEDRTKLVDIVEQIAKKAEEKKPEITVEKTQYKQVSSSEGDKIFPTTEKPPGIEEQLLKTQPTDEDL